MIDPSILRAMLAAGATAEMIVVAVEAAYKADEAKILADREYERERKRVYRLSRGHHSCPGDIGVVPGTSGDIGDKRKAPTPPKENNPLDSSSNYHSPIAPKPLDASFESFWGFYPRKVGKGAARKSYKNALKRASRAEIEAGAIRYAASKPDPEFTKHASTWLNADCWLDELVDKPKSNGTVKYHTPGGVLPGGRLDFKSDLKPMPEISEEEKQANLAKLKQLLKPRDMPKGEKRWKASQP
jgi:hypothetical protein